MCINVFKLSQIPSPPRSNAITEPMVLYMVGQAYHTTELHSDSPTHRSICLSTAGSHIAHSGLKLLMQQKLLLNLHYPAQLRKGYDYRCVTTPGFLLPTWRVEMEILPSCQSSCFWLPWLGKHLLRRAIRQHYQTHQIHNVFRVCF